MQHLEHREVPEREERLEERTHGSRRGVAGARRQRSAHGDREAAHAWAELHVEEYGWIGFDPSTGRCPDDAYVRVAVGLDYGQAAPLSGWRFGGGVEELEVGVRVGLSQTQPQ